MAIKVDPDLSTLLCHKCIRKNFIFCPRSNILYIIYIYYIYNILYIICIAHTQNTQLYPHHHPDCMCPHNNGRLCTKNIVFQITDTEPRIIFSVNRTIEHSLQWRNTDTTQHVLSLKLAIHSPHII